MSEIDKANSKLDVYYKNKRKESERVGGQFADITRRDECADKIAASMALAVDMAHFFGKIKADDVAELTKTIPQMAYHRADALILEGRKGGE